MIHPTATKGQLLDDLAGGSSTAVVCLECKLEYLGLSCEFRRPGGGVYVPLGLARYLRHNGICHGGEDSLIAAHECVEVTQLDDSRIRAPGISHTQTQQRQQSRLYQAG